MIVFKSLAAVLAVHILGNGLPWWQRFLVVLLLLIVGANDSNAPNDPSSDIAKLHRRISRERDARLNGEWG